ncbi:MAG: hypothetical protein GY710_24065 [Desulfobacteraceae bacterium]|nr:hypothetical protein [Desulfobacteraceae bacterium]
MNSTQDLGFLQNGMFSMLSSRLSDPGKVDVLDRETVDKFLAKAQKSNIAKGTITESKARIIGANMGVDYILFGSLTHFGDSVSLDAKMVDITGKKPTLSFFEQSNKMGDVIPLVNSFAGDINKKVFHRNLANELYVQQAPQVPVAPGQLQYSGGVGAYGAGLLGQRTSNQKGFSTYLKFDGVIGAMATGDLENDGQVRVVAATDNNLMIYKFEGNRLVQTKKLEFPRTNRIVSLDIADINKNGYPEIFVTSLTIQRDGLQSFVVEYNGKDYVTTVEDQSLYYRTVNTPDGTKVLLGQERGSNPFDGRINIMMPEGTGYTKEKRIRMPRYTSDLSLARGPVTSDKADEYVMINEFGRLVVANNAGSSEWESTEKYGLTGHVWLMPREDTDASYRERVYLHPRIKFQDIGADGKKELVVVKNNEVGGGTFGRYKRFKDGHIEILAWNGIAMAPVFQTMAVQGWISDFALADIDGDGTKELIVSVVSSNKLSILSKDTASSIICYKLI